jgi:WD40 repeat protein
MLVQPCAGDSGVFGYTGSLNAARYGHTATLLRNGKVLVAGGADSNYTPLASAELYDPALGTWAATGSLATTRSYHTATLLPDGKVLVAGGYDLLTLTSAEVYDPDSGTWAATGNLNTARMGHTATLLYNGRVLVVGGFGTGPNPESLTSAELYDPDTRMWTATGDLNTARNGHTLTVLRDGNVLVAGGFNFLIPLTSAEVYNVYYGIWTATGSLNTARYGHTAILLRNNGKVLVAGGQDIGQNPLASAELYDPALGTWTVTTGSLNAARYGHTATSLPNGKVLVAGGLGTGFFDLSSAELYDSDSEMWSATGDLYTARGAHKATLLPNGEVLVAGGHTYANGGNGRALASAELYGHPAFFNGETVLGSFWYYLLFANGTPFGYYGYLANQNFIYHIDLGYEYLFDPNDANHGIFFYDFASNHIFYTSPSTFPGLYDFNLNTWLYYLPDFNNPGRYSHNPRWFYNFATGMWITL